MKKLMLILILLLAACSSNSTLPPSEVFIKPARPAALLSPNVEFVFLQQDEITYIALKQADFEDYVSWLNEVLGYIKEQNKLLDFYESRTAE